ncbi:MAG: mechanosensitive ion channel [Planctomycetes bacterium]|nr:mechanosensitive ion channel [Planctomycetota bacterium]
MDYMQGLGSSARDNLIGFAPKVAGAIAVLLIGWIVARFLKRILQGVLDRAKVDSTLTNFLCNTSYMALMVFVAISAIGQLGVNTASFVAILGAATFAVGFALQGSLSNFASGVMMILFRPIRQGDLVEAGGVLGTVVEVGVFATIINTLDNKRAIVANGNIMGGNIINYSANGMLRVDMTFGIGYGDDMNKAMSIMQSILAADERVLKDPSPDIACAEHGESSVNFVCRPYVHPDHYWDVWFDTHKAVKEQFDAQGISIPFPQRDVHMMTAG